MYRLFILAKCDLGHAETVGEAVAELDEVSEVYSVTGDHDLLIKVTFEDLQSISDFVQDKLHRVAHLRETQTMMSFRVYGSDIGDFVN
ncbi:Lrp/AsnC ligand binding domain-containing protein [Pacificimonas flava]|uniref:Putative transcriptional regulator, AsnC family n=1 Tax=Pacificimonas flava TaxID=1234595 RepID=M2U1Y8_9SPHN|nr:Lrp/AsnC ligand binding domain-containing protein [Pacificimonas flava]EMD82007.1 putative transcriptional regulator, AsnC family [Pacificimonas flava]MBB5280430.1 DNA-binding Lrp family transcriptional regulator [Pacificimonas flava]